MISAARMQESLHSTRPYFFPTHNDSEGREKWFGGATSEGKEEVLSFAAVGRMSDLCINCVG